MEEQTTGRFRNMVSLPERKTLVKQVGKFTQFAKTADRTYVIGANGTHYRAYLTTEGTTRAERRKLDLKHRKEVVKEMKARYE